LGAGELGTKNRGPRGLVFRKKAVGGVRGKKAGPGEGKGKREGGALRKKTAANTRKRG